MPKNYPLSRVRSCGQFDVLIDRIVSLRRSGLSTYSICKKTGISAETVKRWLKKVGEYNPQWEATPPERRAAIFDLYASGVEITEIASRTGVHASTVQNLCKIAGVRRTRSDAQAVRSIRDPSVGKMQGLSCAFQSAKNGCWIPASSAYEYVRMEMLEADDRVSTFARCVDRILYEFRGAVRVYNPDLTVKFVDGSFRVEEIKPLAKVADDRNLAKFSAARSFYASVGIDFLIVTERDTGIKDAARSLGGKTLFAMPDAERAARRSAVVARYRAKKLAQSE